MAGKVVKSFGTGALAARAALAWIRQDPRAAELRRTNFHGRTVTLAGGPALAVGATVGAIAAAIAAVGSSLVIPGLGLVIAGPAAAALAGAGAGGVTGGLIGALVGWGISEERVKHYEAGIREGGIVMGVRPRSDEDAEHLEREWKANKGEHVYR